MERLARRRLDTPLIFYREIRNPHYTRVRILSFLSLTVRREYKAKGCSNGWHDPSKTAKNRDRDQNWQYDLHGKKMRQFQE